VMRASIVAEKIGIPSVTIVETGFMRQALAITKAYKADLPIAEYPGQIFTDPPEEFERKLRSVVTDAIVAALSKPVTLHESTTAPYEPDKIVFRGSLAEVDDHFYENGWTEGLPIVPPTRERIEAFLSWTDRDRNDVIAILNPELREASVLNIAVNGVMAGCRPEYMPILIAAVECISDPDYRVEDAGSTPGWEPLIIVDGPIVEQLDFNTEAGAMRPGKRANSSIGRFLNLYMRNVAGLRPSTTSKGTIGANFNVALAENMEACAQMGWKPMSADTRGFMEHENVVTVRSVVSVTGPTYTSGHTAERHVGALAEFIGQSTSAFWSMSTGLLRDKWSSLYVMSPRVANVIAKDGWSKRDVAQYIYEHCTIPMSVLERYSQGRTANSENWTFEEGVLRASMPEGSFESDDPDRPVRVNMSPDWIEIVVAGDPARNQSRGYMGNHQQGFPVSRKVELPTGWADRLHGQNAQPT